MADDEGVPPLEDMTELIQQIETIKEQNSRSKKLYNGTKKKEENDKPAPQKSDHASDKKQTPSMTNESNTGYCGFRKGFLLGPSSKPSQPVQKTTPVENKNDDIPLIKPKDPESKNKQFEMPEVQAAMNASQSFLQNKDWVTDDLLSKVEGNEILKKRMADPSFMQALAEFQTNPQAAMSKYHNNREVQMFLKEFCGILGDHFLKLDANKPETAPAAKKTNINTKPAASGADISVRKSTNPHQPTADDEAQMQRILSDPEVRCVLMDPTIQELFEALRTNPNKAQGMLRTSDVTLQRKIKTLVDAGLLQIQR